MRTIVRTVMSGSFAHAISLPKNVIRRTAVDATGEDGSGGAHSEEVVVAFKRSLMRCVPMPFGLSACYVLASPPSADLTNYQN